VIAFDGRLRNFGAEVQKQIDEQRKKESRLASLYEEYFDRIAHYIYVRIGDRHEAEDLAGDVFLKALESLKSYKERGIPMQAWLFRIARNVSVDYLRKKGRVTTVPIEGVTIMNKEDPVAAAEKNIGMKKVREAMQKLTPEQRQVVQLRFFGGLSSKEVGTILRKSDGAVREMQRAAVERLRILLGW
jgi:RNA polymerase sigma-70 factor (ECF subfamily)